MRTVVKYLAFLAVAASALVSCKEELVAPDENPQTGEYVYTFTLGEPETKAALDSDSKGYFARWESEDQLGVFTMNGNADFSINKAADIDVTKSPVEFKIVSEYALEQDSEIYAYFPFDENNTELADSPEEVYMSIPSEQKGSLSAMPMVAKPYIVKTAISADTQAPIADIKMRNLGSVLLFNVFSTNAAYRSETVNSIEFKANQDICGDFVYDITASELADIEGISGRDITLTKDLTPGESKTDESNGIVPMIVAPNAKTGYTGTIVVTTDIASYTYTLSSAIKIDRSAIKKINVDLGSVNADRQANNQVFFIETFDTNDGTGANDGNWATSVATSGIKADHYGNSDSNLNWTFVKGNGASACVKFGSSNGLGSAETPGLNATGTVKLTFKAAAWNNNNENTPLKLSCDNSNVEFYNSENTKITSVTMAKASWTTYTVTVKNLVKGNKIKFEGYQASNSRFFLDNVAVYIGTAPSFVIDPTTIEISDATVEIVAGKTKKLNLNFTPINATNKAASWKTDNDAVATVEDGIVTAIGAGSATITATSEADPSLVATCAVTVIAEPLVMTNVTCAPGKDYLDFSWDEVANAVGYKYSEDNATWSETITETSYRISGLADNTTKTLYVKAIGNGSRYGESEAKSASGTTSSLTAAYFIASDYSEVGTSYVASEKSFTSATGTWVYKNVSLTSNMLQIQASTGYVAITTPGPISKVEIYNVENGSGSAMASNKTFYWKDGTSTTAKTIDSFTTSSGFTKDATVTLTTDPSSNPTLTAVISCTNALRTNKIMVYYEEDGKKSVAVKTVSNGTITANPLRQTPGETVTLSNTPATGYELLSYDVKDASNNSIRVSEGAFTMPESDVTVGGTFSKVNYTLTDISSANGSIVFSKNPANYQDVVTVTPTPATGYRVKDGSLKAYKSGDESTIVTISSTNTITMPAYPVTVSCEFVDASIKETLDAPIISDASGTTTAVSGTWGAVQHATGYIWYVTDSSTWVSAEDASVKASGSVASTTLSGSSLGTTLAAGDYYLYVQATDNTDYYNTSGVSVGKKYTVVAGGETNVVINKTTTGSDAGSYVTTDTQFTKDGVDYKVKNWNPSTLQVRGNQSTAGNNFHIFNTTAMPSGIKTIVVTVDGTIAENKIFVATGTSAQTTHITSGTQGTYDSTAKTLTFTLNTSNRYFTLCLTNGATSGTVKFTNIKITY